MGNLKEEKFNFLLKECKEEMDKFLNTSAKIDELVKKYVNVKESYHQDVFAELKNLYNYFESLRYTKLSMNAKIELLEIERNFISSLNEQQTAQLIVIKTLIPFSEFFKKLEGEIKNKKVKGEDVLSWVKEHLKELEDVKSKLEKITSESIEKIEKRFKVIKKIGGEIGSAVKEAIKEHKGEL